MQTQSKSSYRATSVIWHRRHDGEILASFDFVKQKMQQESWAFCNDDL